MYTAPDYHISLNDDDRVLLFFQHYLQSYQDDEGVILKGSVQ